MQNPPQPPVHKVIFNHRLVLNVSKLKPKIINKYGNGKGCYGVETVGTNVMERIGEVCVVPEGKYVLRWGTPGLFLYVETSPYGAPWFRGTTYTNINVVGMGEPYITR